MKHDPGRHHRHSIRLKGHDYTQPGAYLVTICTWERECLFGHVVNGEMQLSEYGTAVHEEWLRTAELRENVEIEACTVMPNHLHGIIVTKVGARRAVPLRRDLANR